MPIKLILWPVVAGIAVIAALVLMRPLSRLFVARPSVTLVYDVDVSRAYDPAQSPEAVVAGTVKTFERRLDALGITPRTTVTGARVELDLAPTAKAPLEQLERLLARSGRLEFLVADEGTAYMQTLATKAPFGVKPAPDSWMAGGMMRTDISLTATNRAALEAALATLVKDDPVPADHELAVARESAGRPARTYYLFRRAELTGDDITDAELSTDPRSGRQELDLAFDKAGADRLERLTAGAVGHELAIVLDGEVLSAPVIESKVAGGHARIALVGAQPLAEMEVVIAALRSGSLAAPVRLASVRGAKAK